MGLGRLPSISHMQMSRDVVYMTEDGGSMTLPQFFNFTQVFQYNYSKVIVFFGMKHNFISKKECP